MHSDDAPVMIISADGHATARMPDYREYLDPAWRDEFDAFCAEYEDHGSHNFEPQALSGRLDPELVEQWVREVLEPGRTDGNWNPDKRIEQMDLDGISGEVVIPDFGLPFEMYSPLLSVARGYPRRTHEQTVVANRAYNRWLADFCSVAPERFAGMASVAFEDVDAAVAEIRRVHAAGLRGVMLPMFPEDSPLFDRRYDPIWDTLVELEMPVNSHVAISGISDRAPTLLPVPHPGCLAPLVGAKDFFDCHQLLAHLIWGGVLERYPGLKVVFTEQGTGWLIGALQAYDYSWDGSYLRRDVREVVKRKPSEYFHRQCFAGSSLLSRAEVAARAEIGIDRMTFGVDYPHHEGTWAFGRGTRDYLQATFGAAGVPVDEARAILGENSIGLWGFDMAALQPIVDRVGPHPSEILTPPTTDRFPRGDVHKPLSVAAGNV